MCKMEIAGFSSNPAALKDKVHARPSPPVKIISGAHGRTPPDITL